MSLLIEKQAASKQSKKEAKNKKKGSRDHDDEDEDLDIDSVLAQYKREANSRTAIRSSLVARSASEGDRGSLR